ncbi:hypothetical protein DPEC_G00014460 [Dallia pectoralis]|uniref:Uncharacterized protein n=1 Tax=Dallia pectoralis TaxID=75939 RepID=A0ACC2HN57_DALPE|nr:hypothetical protein DPEC_G00014460 [Dallia pectoralis]
MHSLTVKWEVLLKLSEKVTKEEKSVWQAEKTLDKNETTLANVIKEDDENKTQAIKMTSSDISKNKQIINEFSLYTEFLLNLSPPGVARETAGGWTALKQEAQLADMVKPGRRIFYTRHPGGGRESVYRKLAPVCDPENIIHPLPKVALKMSGIDVKPVCSGRQEPELYFTDPQQMFDLLV